MTKHTWGQFHQPAGAKRKCAGRHHLAQKDAAQFHQQNCNQLYWCTDFEVMPNIYAVYPSLYTIKFSINLLAKKPLIKWLWYWPLVDVYACLLVCVCVFVCVCVCVVCKWKFQQSKKITFSLNFRIFQTFTKSIVGWDDKTKLRFIFLKGKMGFAFSLPLVIART